LRPSKGFAAYGAAPKLQIKDAQQQVKENTAEGIYDSETLDRAKLLLLKVRGDWEKISSSVQKALTNG